MNCFPTLRAVDYTVCVSVAFLSFISWLFTDKGIAWFPTVGVVVPIACSEVIVLTLGSALVVAAAAVSAAVTVTAAMEVAEAWLCSGSSP